MSYGLLQRWRPSSRSALIPTRVVGRRVFSIGDIEARWIVRDRDGRRLGTVGTIDPAWIHVRRGAWHGALRVPVSAVHEVHEGEVTLNEPGGAFEGRR